jgi:molybdopterin converting factor subunit 1
MIVTIHLFALPRELVGPSAEVDMPDGATVAQLRAALALRYPVLDPLLAYSAIAVNHDFADDSRVIFRGDEVAVIPPVSGG